MLSWIKVELLVWRKRSSCCAWSTWAALLWRKGPHWAQWIRFHWAPIWRHWDWTHPEWHEGYVEELVGLFEEGGDSSGLAPEGNALVRSRHVVFLYSKWKLCVRVKQQNINDLTGNQKLTNATHNRLKWTPMPKGTQPRCQSFGSCSQLFGTGL